MYPYNSLHNDKYPLQTGAHRSEGRRGQTAPGAELGAPKSGLGLQKKPQKQTKNRRYLLITRSPVVGL